MAVESKTNGILSKTFTLSENGVVSVQSGGTAISGTRDLKGGILIEGTTGTLYGTRVTPTEDFTVPAEVTLTIKADQTLDISGVNATNEGTVEVYGTLIGEFTGSGDVIYHAKSVSLDQTEIQLTAGRTQKLTPVFDPENTTDQTLTWASENSNIATVDNGVVTGVAPGETTITATATDGSNVFASCKVEVVQLVTYVGADRNGVNPSTAEATITETHPGYLTIYYEVGPTDANNQVVKAWTSHPDISEVVEVTPVSDQGVGSITIRVTDTDSTERTVIKVGAKATDGSNMESTFGELTIYRGVDAIQLSETNLALKIGATRQIEAVALPNYAYNKTVVWSSSNESVATVDQAGNVKAVGKGTAVITAAAKDGSGATATCTVTVQKKSSSYVEYNLNFDANGGDSMSTTVEEGNIPIDLDQYVPTRNGYQFVGWYADEELTKPIDTITLTESAKIYAKWEKIEEEVEEEIKEEIEEEEQEETAEPEETAVSFTDVRESDWFYQAVSYAVDNNLMSGMGDGTFSPNTPLNREMLAVILYNLAERPASDTVTAFADVSSGQWYTEAILWAAENNIVAGYDDGSYGVGQPVTREEFAAILYRFANFYGYDTTVLSGTARTYSDFGKASSYAEAALIWAVDAGIISGMDDGTLAPQGRTTRAEAATMLMNFCQNAVK